MVGKNERFGNQLERNKILKVMMGTNSKSIARGFRRAGLTFAQVGLFEFSKALAQSAS
jgi:hypothetical protein